MKIHLRNASKRDTTEIDKIIQQYPTIDIDMKNVAMLVVAVLVDDDGKELQILALGSLVKLLEASFLCDKELDKSLRLKSMELLIDQSKIESKQLGFNIFHAFVGNALVERTLKKHFGFIEGKGKNLILDVG